MFKPKEREEMGKRTNLLACSAVLVLTLFMAFAQEASARQGLVQVAEGIYSYADVKGGGPQNSFGANAGIVVGSNGILVVDTLISAKEAKKFIADIRVITDKPVKYVVNTHYHLDHTFGNCEFAGLGAIVISQANDKKDARDRNADVLKNSKQYGLTEQDMEGTAIVLPDLTFTDRMEVDLGDQKVQLIYPKASHTSGSVLVLIPDKKVLFAGDTLFTNFHPFMADGDIKSWVNVLNYILTLDVNKIVPGHGPISSKLDVLEMRQYITAFDKKAKRLSAKSKDVDHIASEIKKSLPARADGDWLVKANIQMRYLKK